MTMADTRSKMISVRIKPQLHRLIAADALEADVSESQIIRSILARHYESNNKR